MSANARILVIDDGEDDREILSARLAGQGFSVRTAADGIAGLNCVDTEEPDLILLDLMMPRLDGLGTLARLRARPAASFIPVIMLTAKGDVADVVAGLEAGANEYLVKPIDHAALVARVRAMLRLKALTDELARRTAELADLNGSLTLRVEEQLSEISRMSRLARFLAPQVVESILASPDGERLLESHRREVAVLFCDLRGFTAFAERAKPEELMELLNAYHEMLGRRIFAAGGTLERFAGDAVMVLFNDPVAAPDYVRRAIELAFAIVSDAKTLLRKWKDPAVGLDVGIGIAAGYATLGKIGFEGRFDYAAIGTVTNMASRLSDEAAPSQILVTAPVADEAASFATVLPLGGRHLKGFTKPIPIFELAPREHGSAG